MLEGTLYVRPSHHKFFFFDQNPYGHWKDLKLFTEPILRLIMGPSLHEDFLNDKSFMGLERFEVRFLKIYEIQSSAEWSQ